MKPRYKIERGFSKYKIYVRGLFKWYEFNNTIYNSTHEAVQALNDIIKGETCIIKIER